MDDNSIYCIIEQTQPIMIIIDQENLKRISKMINNFNFIKHLILIGDFDDSSIVTSAKITLYKEVIKMGHQPLKNVISIPNKSPNDLCAILYTSGSTGTPKGSYSYI